MFVETIDGKSELQSLCLGGMVDEMYNHFKSQIKKGAKRIYMSLDFPSRGDIDNDLVAIASFENNEFGMMAIPYDESGEIICKVLESETLTEIRNQFVKRVSL